MKYALALLVILIVEGSNLAFAAVQNKVLVSCVLLNDSDRRPETISLVVASTDQGPKFLVNYNLMTPQENLLQEVSAPITSGTTLILTSQFLKKEMGYAHLYTDGKISLIDILWGKGGNRIRANSFEKNQFGDLLNCEIYK